MKNVGSLMQGIQDKKIKCRIDGCNNTWIWTGKDQLKAMLAGDTKPPSKMCDRCYSLFQQKQDLEMPCSSPGCDGTWKYSRIAQVQDEIKNRKPPKRLCLECKAKGSELSEIQVPCKIEGCNNTWTWTVKDQLLSKDKTPPKRMCPECYDEFKKLKDKEIKCKVKGCNNTWIWTKYSQLEAKISGKPIPKRFCKSCSEHFATFEDIEVTCKIEGCNNTWIWTRYARLEALAAGNDPDTPPQKMCSECSEKYFNTKEETHKCRIPGCNNIWTEKRGSVFRRLLKNEPPPKRLCDECYNKLSTMEDIQVPCKYSKLGCTDTWTWKKEAVLRIIKQTGNDTPHPPQHACKSCETYLNKTSGRIECEKCGTFIMELSTENLIRIKFGLQEEPVRICSQCKQKSD